MEKDFDLYAAFYQAKKEMANWAKDEEISRSNAYKKLEECFNNCRPIVAEQIYALCNRVNGVLEMLRDTMPETNQFDVKVKPSIFLTGEFSGGKTTLIHELAGHKSGSEGGGPETASIVIHKCAKESGCEVYFEKDFIIEKSAEFQEILHSHNIRTNQYFDTKGNAWHFKKESIEKSDWGINEIQGFISDMAKYPNAIKRIIWTHCDCPSYSPLNYAILYDMPGTGGNESHDTVISKVFEDEKPDIICYVIDTDSGEPGKVAAEQIKEIASKCLESNTMLFWLYSKPSTDKEQEIFGECKSGKYWLDDKRNRLTEYIDSLYAAPNPKSDSDDTEHIESVQIEYELNAVQMAEATFLKNAPIIDARNSFVLPTDNTAHAMNAFAIIIQQYYIKILEKFVATLNAILTKFQTPEVFDLFVKSPQEDYPEKLISIFNDIDKNKESLDLKNFDSVSNAIKERLHIDDDDEFANPKIKKYVRNQKDNIVNKITKVLSKFTYRVGWEIDLNKFYNYKEYLNDELQEENLLFFDVQVYHWFKMFYRNQITGSYTHEFCNSLYIKLKAMLDDLKEYKTNVMYILK